MKIKFRRKHLLFTLVILLGVLLVAWEIFQYVPSLRRQYLHYADRRGDLDTLVQFLGDDDQFVRGDAGNALAARGTQSVPALVRGLDDKSTQIRMLCIWTLGRIGPAANETLPLLKARMNSDPLPRVQSYCAQAIGMIGYSDPGLVAELLDWLKNGDDRTRLLSVYALSAPRIPKDVVRPALTYAALNDGDPAVKDAAQHSIGMNAE